MEKRTISTSLIGLLAVSTAACSKDRLGTDNPDVAADYEDTQYRENIVTGRERRNYKDQGKGITPKTLTAIEHTITSVYERDFERCLEEEMDRQKSRFLRSVFTVEFTIETSGKVSAAKVLEMKAGKQNAKGKDIGAIDTGDLTKCFHEAVLTWEFDPAPEVQYVHTYRGQVGEAF